jgi:hypothetical protein
MGFCPDVITGRSLWQGWRFRSLLATPLYCAPLPVTSMDCCWAPVKFPWWVPVSCRPSLLLPVGRHGAPVGVIWAGEGSHMHSTEVHCGLQRGLLFLPAMWCGSASAHWVPAAILSRLPAGHLCCLGTDLLHVVLLVKVSALPALLGEPVLGSSARRNASLQMFLHIFCCFTPFRFRQNSASHCLWDLWCVFRGPQFPCSFWFVSALEFGVVSNPPSWIYILKTYLLTLPHFYCS